MTGSRGPSPVWPKGPIPMLALAGFVSGLSIAFLPGTRVGPLAWLYSFGTTLFRGEFGLKLVMGLAACAHAVESLFMLRKCQQRGCTPADSAGWIVMTWLIGYGAHHSFNAVEAQKR